MSKVPCISCKQWSLKVKGAFIKNKRYAELYCKICNFHKFMDMQELFKLQNEQEVNSNEN